MSQSTDLRVRTYGQILNRHKIAIIAVTMVVLVLGVTPSLLEAERYSSVASVRVRPDDVESPFDDGTEQNATNRSRDLLTDVEILKAERTRALVVSRLGDDAAPFEEMTPTLIGFSEVIEIRVVARSPEAAADAANAYAEVYVEQRQLQSVQALTDQAAELRSRSGEATQELNDLDLQLSNPDLPEAAAENLLLTRASLSGQILDFNRRADELEVEAALREGGTEIVTRAALELTPISPKPLQAAVKALVLGVLAGVAAAVLLEIAQDRLADAEALASIDEAIPILASVPPMDPAELRRGALGPSGREGFRYLRTSIRYRSQERPIRSVVVTSATSGEGKTFTSVNLARAMAEAGSRVVLVDADLRKPAVHERLDLANDAGLVDVLSGRLSFGEAVHYVEPTLAVLTAGSPSESANELLGQLSFSRLVRDVVRQCDFLVIDAPPVLPVADPLLVARSVDTSILVARVGSVRRREVRALVRRFQEAHLPIVGFVANDSESELSYGDYTEYVAT